MAVDPFSLKQMSKVNPSRILLDFGCLTKQQRLHSRLSGRGKKRHSPLLRAIRRRIPPWCPNRWAPARSLERIRGGRGCYRRNWKLSGVTTRELATRTGRQIFAIDPFMGYGGAEADLEFFKSRVADQPHVTHLRKTSGAAARDWPHGRISFVFIDAVHDYANTWFDAQTWGSVVQPGGFIDFHEIDSWWYVGTHFAAARFGRGHEVFRRVEGLVIFRKPN